MTAKSTNYTRPSGNNRNFITSMDQTLRNVVNRSSYILTQPPKKIAKKAPGGYGVYLHSHLMGSPPSVEGDVQVHHKE